MLKTGEQREDVGMTRNQIRKEEYSADMRLGL
jgi:hypothetical protein